MKKVKSKLALFVFVAGLSLAGFATGIDIKGNDASKAIGSQITLPDNLRKTGYSEKVKVIFTVNENGEVNNVIAATLNNELKSAIEKQFLSLCFTGLKSNVANSVVLNFKVY